MRTITRRTAVVAAIAGAALGGLAVTPASAAASCNTNNLCLFNGAPGNYRLGATLKLAGADVPISSSKGLTCDPGAARMFSGFTLLRAKSGISGTNHVSYGIWLVPFVKRGGDWEQQPAVNIKPNVDTTINAASTTLYAACAYEYQRST
ncbi:hypothetical protein GCM10009678_19080 [Actinomadura kijaniata]|uniref:Peptidase inhibitor family I36 n=1 Tax=Actinomadura namibiensis TaxID=182080 RepID=A0A7W3LXP8_ACTNM|nr:hypothetical protein [Actinomadura namibiensis]MBA8956154.1 hypothetical protein [Actinomadura namibiensis]